jgi:hypothetical protein
MIETRTPTVRGSSWKLAPRQPSAGVHGRRQAKPCAVISANLIRKSGPNADQSPLSQLARTMCRWNSGAKPGSTNLLTSNPPLRGKGSRFKPLPLGEAGRVCCCHHGWLPAVMEQFPRHAPRSDGSVPPRDVPHTSRFRRNCLRSLTSCTADEFPPPYPPTINNP